MLLLVCQNKLELMQTVIVEGVGIAHVGHNSWRDASARSVLHAV